MAHPLFFFYWLMKQICLRVIVVAFLFLWGGCSPLKAQQAVAGVDVFSFFDNSEGDDTYRPSQTFGGIRFAPQLTLATADARHRVVGGYDFLYEHGTRQVGEGSPRLYYQYANQGFRVLVGSFPRTLMHEQMPEYLICDSIRYFRPEVTGFDFLYTTSAGHFEAFLDWTQKRTDTEREQFMAGISTRFRLGWLQVGLEGYYYHYALENQGLAMGHHIHDNLVAHPFVGALWDWKAIEATLDVRAGLLFQADRDRGDSQWHSPVGFVGDVDGRWQRFSLHETFYGGMSQQHFGNSGFGEYYWGDTFVQSPWYSRTDLSYTIVDGKHASLNTGLIFHFTDKGMLWHQMLTLRSDLSFVLIP